MKIFCFGSDYPPTGGGISTHTQEWLRGLAEEKDIRVRATIFGNKEPRVEKVGGVIEMETLKSVNFFYVGFRILRDIYKYRHYDVFHSFNLFPVGFWTVFWTKVLRKKSVITFYGADACDKRTSAKVVWLQRWAIKHATHAITITEFTKKKVMERYSLSKVDIKVVHPILPKCESGEGESVRKRLGIAPTDFVVLSVSRLVKRKGLEFLVNAISEISDPQVKLLIVGGGPERDTLERLVKNKHLEDRVLFVGRVPVRAPYYNECDVAVLVSYSIEEEGDFEGLGLTLLEAQSYGKPVIGSRSGGIPEALEEGRTGLLVPERDSRAIADAILYLKHTKEFYASMQKMTGVFLQKEFGRDATIGKYLHIVNGSQYV